MGTPRKEPTVGTFGAVIGHVDVTIGPQFLNLFSEHLYSSPNKAFEELVANGWDAGANTVYIGLPEDLGAADTLVWVLDDGESMATEGLKLLWNVANSTKRDSRPGNNRPQIGKFGIGKLATYILAHELTYVCKAKDGKMRAVTMDYRRIDQAIEKKDLHIKPLPLDLREVDFHQIESILSKYPAGESIVDLLRNNVPPPGVTAEWLNEFKGQDPPPVQKQNTWTLVLLSSLKKQGQEMQPGFIKRMLRSALPLGSGISIVFNDETLTSTKIGTELQNEWDIGPGLGITSVEISDDESRKVSELSEPIPHVRIDGIDSPITGTVRLFKESISGGKSEALGPSNGFHINILGRVVNEGDLDFGLSNLSHSAWAQFRTAIRCDALDKHISVNRQDLKESDELKAFRSFLMALFNKARNAYNSAKESAWSEAGKELTKAWSAMPLLPLERIIVERLRSNTEVPDFIDATGVQDKATIASQFEQTIADQPGDLIKEVVLEPLLATDPFARYDVASRRVVINTNHPFAKEHSETREQQQLLQDTAIVNLLTEAYMIDVGIDEEQLKEARTYRDQLLRLLAQLNRKSGAQIADLLIRATKDEKGLERIIGDALEYLGFEVEPLGDSGEPEGIATAPIPPGEGDQSQSYRFTYDAKSTKNKKNKTGNLNIAGLVRHRNKHNANHILLVGVEFEKGALEEESKGNGVTPVRAKDLARLLLLAVETGPLDLKELHKIFEIFTPLEVEKWIDNYSDGVRSAQKVTLDQVLDAIQQIGYQSPNATTTTVIADRIANRPGSHYSPTRLDIRKIIAGLQVLAPSLIRINNDDVYLSTPARKLREAILSQISGLPPMFKEELTKAIQ